MNKSCMNHASPQVVYADVAICAAIVLPSQAVLGHQVAKWSQHESRRGCNEMSLLQ